jgi:hypothetical protein
MNQLTDKRYTQEDRIIEFILHPNSVELTKTDKETLEACERIHTMRHNLHSRSQIVAFIVRTEKVGKRQAYNLLYKTEQIFSKAGVVNKEYFRQILLEECLENIRKAKALNPSAHTKAILAAFRVAGLEETLPDLPDFEKLMQHIYKINLPKNAEALFDKIMNEGAIDLNEHIPAPNINTNSFDEAEEVRDGSS